MYDELDDLIRNTVIKVMKQNNYNSEVFLSNKYGPTRYLRRFGRAFFITWEGNDYGAKFKNFDVC
jgi:hypothetical protein